MTEELSTNIFHLTKGSPKIVKGLPFVAIKNAVLGEKYSLNLIFTTSTHTKEMNSKYRGKDEPTDILSFPISKKEGEIFIDIKSAKKEAVKFGRELKNFIQFLFIHGLVHLKGFRHGSTMERQEIKFRKKFGI